MSLTSFAQTTYIETPTNISCNEIDVDVTVQDFTNVGAISLVLHFDPEVLEYRTTGYTINPAISSAITNLQFPFAIPGEFRLGYTQINGISLANNTVLFTLHFNIIPTIVPNSLTSISWSNVIGECEYSSPGGIFVYYSSFINKEWTTPLPLSLNQTHNNISCFGGSNGSIDLTVNGGESPYTYSWTGPSAYSNNIQDITDLAAGTYSVTVTDENFCTQTYNNILLNVNDTILPTVLCKNIDVYLNNTGNVEITADQINNGSSDNCSITTMVLSKTLFKCKNLGLNTDTLIVTDNSGNSAQNTATVTVHDTIHPTITCQAEVNVQADAGFYTASNVSLNNPVITDNCSVYSLINNAPLIYPVGSTSVTWTVTDASGNSTICSQLVTVSPTLISNPDINVTLVDELICGKVQTNDIVPNATIYSSPVLISSPGGSSCNISMCNNGSYTFKANQPGVYTYDVLICETALPLPYCKHEILTITVKASYFHSPIAQTDFATTFQGFPVTINTLVNDEAAYVGGELVPSSVSIISSTLPNPVTEGNVSINTTTGKITFTPVESFTGEIKFTYQVCDNTLPTALCATAMVVVTVLPMEISISAFNLDFTTSVPNSTIAADNYNETVQGINLIVSADKGVLANDMDPEGNSQTVITTSPITIAGKGTVTIAANGSYVFVPIPAFRGGVSFTYTVGDNGSPQAFTNATLYIMVIPHNTDPDINVTLVNIPVTGDVSNNDEVIEGSVYDNNPTPILISSPVGSTAVINVNINGTYIFSANLPGVYIFDISVCVQSLPNLECKYEKLTITVINPMINTVPPIANTDFAITLSGIPATLNTLANDAPGKKGKILLPASVSIVPSTMPDPLTEGSLSVNPLNGEITFTPVSTYTGIIRYSYTVCDNSLPTSLCATAIQQITVVLSGSTEAVDDFNTTVMDEVLNVPVTSGVLSNDTDPEGDLQIVTTTSSITVPGKGTLTIAIDGSYVFVPAPCFYGPVSFPYTIVDNGTPVTYANATLYIVVLPFAAFANGGTIGSDQTVCSNEIPSPISSSALADGYSGNIEYKWLKSVSPFDVWTEIDNSNSVSFYPGLLTISTWYKRIAKAECQSIWSLSVESNVVKITVNTIPEVTADTYSAICIDASDVTLSGMPLTGGIWSGPGVTGNMFDPSLGTQTLTHFYTDTNGCTASAQTTITVNPLPVVNAGSYDTVCSDAADIILDGFPINGEWSGNGVSGSQYSSYYFDPNVGTQTLTYSYIDSTTHCGNFATTLVVINPLPAAPQIANIIQPNCNTPTAIVELNGLPFGNWIIQPGAINGSTTTATISGLNALSVYNYKVTDNNGCSSPYSDNITINAQPSIPSVIVTNPAAVISPATIDITCPDITFGSTPGLFYTYWMNDSATLPYSTPTMATAGTYYIKGSSVAGCYDIDSVRVIVNQIGNICDSVSYVTNNNDSGPGSLRNAISMVCENGIVRFNLCLDNQTILLTTASLCVNKNFSFDNKNHTSGVTINANGFSFNIQSGKTLTLLCGSKITILGTINNLSKGYGGLVIASGASFIHNNINLQATAQRYLNNTWHLFGSPFKKNIGAQLSSMIPAGGSIQLRPYINGANWESNVTSPNYYLQPTVGYAVKPNINYTVSFYGNLYFSNSVFDYTNLLTYSGNASPQSWNLLANPYTAYLNWNLLGITNVSNTLYLWDNNLYPNISPVANASYLRTYNSCSNIGVPANTKPFIAPFQGFFVKAIYNSPKIIFYPSARTHSTSVYYKTNSNTISLLRLKIENDEGADELVICKNPDAKSELDVFDSEKMLSDIPLEIYSESTGGEKLVINTINATNNSVIPLGINGKAGEKATISAFGLESTEQIYLEDRFKGKIISLAENLTYNFEFPSNIITGRFFIRFGNINVNLINSEIKVFQNNNELNIIAQTGERLQCVEIYSISGSCLYKSQTNCGNIFTRKMDLSAGIYLFRVKTSVGIQNIKMNWK